MENATKDDVAFWGCIVIGNLSQEFWQGVFFIGISLVLLSINVYRGISK